MDAFGPVEAELFHARTDQGDVAVAAVVAELAVLEAKDAMQAQAVDGPARADADEVDRLVEELHVLPLTARPALADGGLVGTRAIHPQEDDKADGDHQEDGRHGVLCLAKGVKK